MNIKEAEAIITQAFQNADEDQFINQMEWVLNNRPILPPSIARRDWCIDGVP